MFLLQKKEHTTNVISVKKVKLSEMFASVISNIIETLRFLSFLV